LAQQDLLVEINRESAQLLVAGVDTLAFFAIPEFERSAFAGFG
jgi:hypothetical protein